MKRKCLILSIAMLGTLNAVAWDNLYLVGPGTPTGWDLGSAIGMNQIRDNVWATVCYLDNDGGSSFRVQPYKEYNGEYYGPSADGEVLNYNEFGKISFETENCFSVAYPGVYYIEADLNNGTVKINPMESIYLIGEATGNGWNVGKHSPLSFSDPDIYSGTLALTDGSFKIAVDPKEGNYDERFYLFRDGRGAFKTSIGDDSQWSVGFPDQGSHAEKDLDPGKYHIVLNTSDKSVKFTRKPIRVAIVGDAVRQVWNPDGGIEMTETENGEFVKKHVFINAGSVFKPSVDGKLYGYDHWESHMIVAGEDTYLRNADNGSDLSVATDGFRDVTLFPSASGDGTLGIRISEPQTLYYEGWCTLSYDSDSKCFVNNDYKWLKEGEEYIARIGDDEMGRMTVPSNGWYTAKTVINGVTPNYQMVKQPVTVSINGTTVSLEDRDAASAGYLKNVVFIESGQTVSAMVGDRQSGMTTAGSTGYYSVAVTISNEGNVDLDLRGPISVNMPLKEADFAGGQKHYFLVGQRMGAWRLQPEWEFTPNGDGTYSIPERLLYNGYVMVGVVDNYADYIAQTYSGFSDRATDMKIQIDPRYNGNTPYYLTPLASSGKNGCADGKYTSVRYNEIDRTSPIVQHGCSWENLGYRLINILSADGGATQADLQSSPSSVQSITLTVNENGDPATLTFNTMSVDPAEVAKLRTFSLVGGGIKNQNVTYNRETATSPLNHQPGYGEDTPADGWADAWIQYDSHSNPYVDAHGEFIYQTSFTKNWLSIHPSLFNFGDHFEYTSNNITFTYSPETTHPDQFGQRTFTAADGKTERKEVLYTYSNDEEGKVHGRNSMLTQTNLNDMISVPADRRACYVVEDMWMEGLFKVWSGWGGSATNYEYEENGTTYTRWYRDNAGHGAWREDRAAFYSANTQMAFTLFEDMDAANFGIGYGDLSADNEKVNADGSIKEEFKIHPQRRFFKRVEIWYDLDNNFVYTGERASFLLFVQEQGGPVITAARQENCNNKLRYTFHIPLANGVPAETDHEEFGHVTYYRIERIPIDENGVEGAPVLVAEANDLMTHRNNFGDPDGNIYFNDEAELAPGHYRYQITTKREKTGEEEKTAKSNILAIVDNGGASTGIENVETGENGSFDMTVSLSEGGNLTLRANAEIGLVMLYSINGSLVRSVEMPASAGSINVSALPSGVYIVKAQNQAKRIIKK